MHNQLQFNMKLRNIPRTPFGPVAVLWTVLDDVPRVKRVILSRPGLPACANVPRGSCAEIDALVKSITAILQGQKCVIPLEVADLDSCSAFQRKILRAEYRIPRGRVTTYRKLADAAGIKNGARAAGTALASNPFPLIIPCHRTIRADGFPGEYQGGRAMKKALLEMEGIRFDHSGRAVR